MSRITIRAARRRRVLVPALAVGLTAAIAPFAIADEGMHGGDDPAHGAGAMHEGVAAPPGMRVTGIATRPAPKGLLVRPITKGFRFAPTQLGAAHGKGVNRPRRGHAHLYVDGDKTTLLVGPWTYVPLPPGRHTLKVTLNANDHADYMRDGAPVQRSKRVVVRAPAPDG